jgi:predicted nuclease with RNAse H fold
VLTVGIDLAAEPERTGVAWISWEPGRAVVTRLIRGADDAVLLGAIGDADKAGIDCPLGWPEDFVAFVAAHENGQAPPPPPGPGRDWRRLLTTRLTDRVVREQAGLVPLSVAADRIGYVALRCAALLTRVADACGPVDRSGGGRVVEVYPAGSLQRWGLPHRRYKGAADGPALARMVDELRARAPWLDLGEHDALCRRSHDAADAVIAALTARAAARGLTVEPSREQMPAARKEGWIAIPAVSSLGRLP